MIKAAIEGGRRWRAAGGMQRPGPAVRCGGRQWVPAALVALDLVRRLVSEVDNRSRCGTTGDVQR